MRELDSKINARHYTDDNRYDVMKFNVLVHEEAKWIGHICLLKHTIEGKVQEMIEVKARRKRRSKKLLKEFKETRR